MKKLVVLFALVFVTVTAFAQDRNGLTGPAYKNYKPSKHKTEAKPVYNANHKIGLTGPAYKNYKPGKSSNEVEYQVVSTNNSKAGLTGPAYKNHKPWKNNKVSNDNTVIATENEL
ncbi:hypothetical protein KFZ70_05290 [Tamlana fucoidanivorans]|uniref:Uncharacterized protein n=1 Tax=Allotamlana fucoidanivorans TaxID=2583814 RepID=A0A5C4STX2_9FLAO|nr:hypothetical protein [Tamlana fucoidanivorans]TNJ47071.1 hypothetical protein FGF67_00685 [Tamlana fucoidanivorans]